ncbi:condensation domain-containing protein, partial [Acetobacter senegalensis]|uniref:condensation domain-containing protein n=1 Tax=Acetobacter senegalensis TaxID=446692 RepID=UPI00209FCFC0
MPLSPKEYSPEFRSVSERYANLSREDRWHFRQKAFEKKLDISHLPIVVINRSKQHSYLSHAQERLWFLWNLNPDDAGYNIAGAVRLTGNLDVSALRRA